METTEQSDTAINIAYPDLPDLTLRLTVGACRLLLNPIQDNAWVVGGYHDPTRRLKATVAQDGGVAMIAQKLDLENLLDLFGVSGAPEFDLGLGTSRPYGLTIETGASEGIFDLGGLPLTQLDLRAGAGRYVMRFPAPNPQPMRRLRVSSGAASVELSGLGNANCEEARIEGGAAGFTLDFDGPLRRDMRASVTAGLAGVRLTIPATTPARITAATTLSELNIGDGFMKKEDAFWNEAALLGGTPLLTIRAEAPLGEIKISLR